MDRTPRRRLSMVLILSSILPHTALAGNNPLRLTVQWDKVTRVSQTTPTLQVVVNPPMRRGSSIHENVFKSLRDLKADYVRYVPWFPYPRLGVAELEPPVANKTWWDFSLIDPMTIDFLEATRGRRVILNFSTIPQWMFKTENPVAYPTDPDQAAWDYEQGTELRDPTMKEVGDYYARLFSWYTQGGFTDEAGVRHESGYHYSIPYFEVLNEPEYEHQLSPETYTKLYDVVVEAVGRVQPDTKFVGMALATPSRSPAFFEYFLDHKNHKPGIPLDFISYHFYAVPTIDQSPEVQQYTFFAQADGFLNTVRYIEIIRQRLSPETKTTLDEIGAISADDLVQGEGGHVTRPIPSSYWNLAGATYAYLFGELTRMGVDVVGESQLVGYPTQFPSVSMVDWNTGNPNARYWILKLLHDNFEPGDRVVETDLSSPFVYSLGVVTHDGKRRLLLVNKRDRGLEVSIPGAKGGQQEYVDQTTAPQASVSAKLPGDSVTLGGFAVEVVTLP